MQDTSGNALDQETQLTPHRRNIQDLLCDLDMIPYSEPYQSVYQRRRLGILGIEWRPTSLKLAVGPTYNATTGDFQPLPIGNLEQWVEPSLEVVDAIDWEVENDMQSDDTDSEYNVTDEYLSDGEHESLSNSSSGDAESSAEDSRVDHDLNEGLRRSKRKRHKSEVRFSLELYQSFVLLLLISDIFSGRPSSQLCLVGGSKEEAWTRVMVLLYLGLIDVGGQGVDA
ncbi:unnamed protein product [Musa hybrid cultivar]